MFEGQFFPKQPIQFYGPGKKIVAALALTQKGYGHIYDTGPTVDLSMNYGNVDGGSAPSAGDLVVWFFVAGDEGASPIVDLTGSGWAQQSSWSNPFGATMLAKVVTAGDLSSPPLVINDPVFGSMGFWVAYSIVGSVASVVVSPLNREGLTSSAPSNQTCDSSAINPPNVAITIGAGGGNDGSPSMSMSGATADISFTSAANQWLDEISETQFIVDATVGGANITISKGDDGNYNHMASGYVTVTSS